MNLNSVVEEEFPIIIHNFLLMKRKKFRLVLFRKIKLLFVILGVPGECLIITQYRNIGILNVFLQMQIKFLIQLSIPLFFYFYL